MKNPSMTVGELRKAIRKVPDDTLVVLPDVDHSYRPCSLEHTTMILEDNARNMVEDHGDKNLMDPLNDIRVDAIVIS